MGNHPSACSGTPKCIFKCAKGRATEVPSLESNMTVLAYVMNFNTIKLDNIFVLDFLEELNLLSYRLKGTGVFLLDGDLGRGRGEQGSKREK